MQGFLTVEHMTFYVPIYAYLQKSKNNRREKNAAATMLYAI